LFEDDIGYRTIAEDILAEVTTRHVAEEATELHHDGLIQAHACIQLRAQFGRRPWTQKNGGRIPRDHVDHAKQQGHRQSDDQQGQSRSADYESEHPD
jgi:hypothetical protein